MNNPAFQQGMRNLPAGISIISTALDGRWHGMVATSVTSLSAEPASLLVCLKHSVSMAGPVQRVRAFCVNVLATDHADLPGVFSDPDLRERRFDHGRWSLDMGLPVLEGAKAVFSCRLSQSVSYGTHNILIGDVEPDVRVRDGGMPLIWYGGSCHVLGSAMS